MGGVKNPGGSGTEPGGCRIFLSSVGKINPKLYALASESSFCFCFTSSNLLVLLALLPASQTI